MSKHSIRKAKYNAKLRFDRGLARAYRMYAQNHPPSTVSSVDEPTTSTAVPAEEDPEDFIETVDEGPSEVAG